MLFSPSRFVVAEGARPFPGFTMLDALIIPFAGFVSTMVTWLVGGSIRPSIGHGLLALCMVPMRIVLRLRELNGGSRDYVEYAEPLGQ